MKGSDQKNGPGPWTMRSATYSKVSDISREHTPVSLFTYMRKSKTTRSPTVALFATSDPRRETHRVRITVGEKKITYNGPVFTPTTDLTTAKLHCNSVLSTQDSK